VIEEPDARLVGVGPCPVEVDFDTAIGKADWLLNFPLVKKIAKSIKSLITKGSGLGIDIRQSWAEPASKEGARIANNFDVVVSTFGPASSHFVACEAKKANPKLLWFADYRDLWSDNPNVEITDRQRILLAKMEHSTVGEWADELTTVSQTFADKLERRLTKKPKVFSNGFDICTAELQHNLQVRNKISRSSKIRIVYTGTIYRGSQDPEPLLRALSNLRQSGKISFDDIAVEFYGSRIEVAENLARKPAYAPFIKIMGHVPREKALEAQRESNLLLLLENPATVDNGVLTGKVYEYLAAGSPILSIGSIQSSEISNLLLETGCGICCGTELRKIEDTLLEIIQSQSLPNWYKPDLDEVTKYSRHNQAQKYFEFIESCVV